MMKWYNLKSNKCPKCNKDFMKNLEVSSSGTTDGKIMEHPCGFIINESRYKKIVADMVSASLANRNYNVDEEAIENV